MTKMTKIKNQLNDDHVTIGKPVIEKGVTEPYFVLEIYLMFGDADFEEWEEIAKFEPETYRSIYFYKGKHYSITPEEKKHFDDLEGSDVNLDPEKDTLLDAVVTCMLAMKTRPRSTDDRGWYPGYEHVPGFSNWLYDRMPYRNNMTPKIEDWKVEYVGSNGLRYCVDIDLPKEMKEFVDNWTDVVKT